MKRQYMTTALTCLAMLIIFGIFYAADSGKGIEGEIRVGFIYENDESTPSTYNFALAQSELEKMYPDRVKIFTKNNVLGRQAEEALRELARSDCHIIFTNSESDQVMAIAPEYPNIQFCQVSSSAFAGKEYPDNFHTFNGKIYEGRYVSGIAAGLKLRQMIDSGALTADQAIVGYVCSFPSPEAISGFTAFLLGVRSAAPEAVMKIRYTRVRSSYSQEKACAEALINAGCVVISQHTNTIGPAVACEEAAGRGPVIHVGYNQSMTAVAPTTSLVSTRVNWAPYITGAVTAVIYGQSIERAVPGDAHGNDISGGFERGWVEMMDLNKYIAAPGTTAAVEKAIDGLRRGKLQVFQGEYTGFNPSNPQETYDLRNGFVENGDFSAPSFRYMLRDVVEILR